MFKEGLVYITSLLVAAIGWMIKRIFGKLDKLEEEDEKIKASQSENTLEILSKLKDMEKAIALNEKDDEKTYQEIKMLLTPMAENQKLVLAELQSVNKNLTDLYLNNPDLKRSAS